MNAKQAANQLRGLLGTTYLDSNGELVEMVRDSTKLLDELDKLHVLVSNMPAIDQSNSMNMLWCEQRDNILAKIAAI